MIVSPEPWNFKLGVIILPFFKKIAAYFVPSPTGANVRRSSLDCLCFCPHRFCCRCCCCCCCCCCCLGCCSVGWTLTASGCTGTTPSPCLKAKKTFSSNFWHYFPLEKSEASQHTFFFYPPPQAVKKRLKSSLSFLPAFSLRATTTTNNRRLFCFGKKVRFLRQRIFFSFSYVTRERSVSLDRIGFLPFLNGRGGGGGDINGRSPHVYENPLIYKEFIRFYFLPILRFLFKYFFERYLW